MKKKFALFIFCGFLISNLQAQNFGGGIILGLSTSQVGGDDLGGFNKAGLLVGVYANKSISPLLSFQMEMTFIQKGSNNPKMNDYEHKNPPIPDISLSYIEVPLILQYQQSEILKIEGGIQFANLINGYYNDSYGEITYSGTTPFIKNDIGLLLGMDYKFSGTLSLNTRISNSILPIGEEDYNHPTTYNSTRKGKYNSVLSFAIHYNF
ncbi:MAG: outer membrane beta-barrel protein [Flavobacteriales bacterium]|nr:outer membrane beta-barrel protein [Flavobacteriales bacterium]